jgi:hypothetical protein
VSHIEKLVWYAKAAVWTVDVGDHRRHHERVVERGGHDPALGGAAALEADGAELLLPGVARRLADGVEGQRRQLGLPVAAGALDIDVGDADPGLDHRAGGDREAGDGADAVAAARAAAVDGAVLPGRDRGGRRVEHEREVDAEAAR